MGELTLLDPGFEGRTMGTLLREQARRNPGATWLLHEDDRYTFAEVDALVDRHVAALRAIGVGPGTTVGLMLSNSPLFLALALAIGRLGAVFVPVNLANRREALRHVLAQAEVSVVAIEGDLLERLGEVAAGVPRLRAIAVDGVDRVAAVPALAGLERHDLRAFGEGPSGEPGPASVAGTLDAWCIMFTSGTTGVSKGAVMTHQYWCTVPAELCGPSRDVRPTDVFHVSSPMFHAAAWLVQIIPSLLLGLPVAIDAGFSTTQFWDRVRRHGATQLLTMGATHLWLWKEPPRPGDADNPARVWAPVPLPEALHEPFKARFGIEHLWSTYGGTEFMSVTNTDVRRRTPAGSSGRARPSVELAVLDDCGRPVAPGVVGELCVRPRQPHAIFQGYHGMPAETLARFTDLWYHSGDLVRMDADGEVYFVDRKDDFLRVRGENVSSFEVESAFGKHDAVAEAAAHSVRTAESAQVAEDEIKVCLVLHPDHRVSFEELTTFVAEHLTHFAVPRYLEVVDDLPRTATGRVQKHVLRARGMTAATWDRVEAMGDHRRRQPLGTTKR
jgi:crotonobetaine/carnitine-CoA ligase